MDERIICKKTGLIAALIGTGFCALAAIFSFCHTANSEPQSFSRPKALAQAPRSSTEQQTIDAYKKANRAVVHISTQTATLDFFGPVYREGSGSGVIVDAKRGLVITNSHVISNARRASLTLANGSTYPVRLVGHDPDNELALLQMKDPPGDLVAAPLGDSSALEVGQRVLAIGNPFGLQRTLTTGIISSLGRTIRSETGILIGDVIQTDAAINPGNSGGPLLDTAGRIIGLNTAILSRSGESAGIGFAIPVNQIKKALPQLIKYGRVLRPKTGIVFADTDYGTALFFVEPGSPGEKAGLNGALRLVKKGRFTARVVDYSKADFVISVNGTEVNNQTEALSAIVRTERGEKVKIVVRTGIRSGKLKEVEIKPVWQ